MSCLPTLLLSLSLLSPLIPWFSCFVVLYLLILSGILGIFELESLGVFQDEDDLEIDNDISQRSMVAGGLDSEDRLIRFAL
jgi:uncharacterized membrane protein YdbT with pleckstrin-like domain